MLPSKPSRSFWFIPHALILLSILLLNSVEQASAQNRTEPNFVISLETGDRCNCGTAAFVYIRLYDGEGGQSENISIFDLQNVQSDVFEVPIQQEGSLKDNSKIVGITIWKESLLAENDWFVEKIVVQNRATQTRGEFPIQRLVQSQVQMNFIEQSTLLPQDDPFRQQREAELARKREIYVYDTLFPGSPVVANEVPKDEEFTLKYKLFVDITMYDTLVANENITANVNSDWTSDADIKDLYHQVYYKTPTGAYIWESDIFFGWKRVAGLNPQSIKLVTKIPDKFPVENALHLYLLEGMTIDEAIDAKKLFIVDLSITDGIRTRYGYVVCSPIALFFLNSEDQLVPVAIQLFQKPGADNPIFTPDNPHRKWQLAKMWFNNAEAQVYVANTLFATKHLFMEGILVATHRQLSPSHPIFKILAPHFLFLIARNSYGSGPKIWEEGITNTVSNVGAEGMMDLITSRTQSWRMDVDGMLPEEMKSRGVHDPEVLPNYPYRDDGLLVFNAIQKYANEYVNIYYPNDAILTEDTEIQNWVAEIVAAKNGSVGGVGLLGIPGNGTLTEIAQLVDIVTSVIWTCSADHAAVNFPMYEELGFPLNYPLLLRGKPPTDPKKEALRMDIIDAAAQMDETLHIMSLSTIHSSFGTNPLGEFETQYTLDSRAMAVVDDFRKELLSIGKEIEQRNIDREDVYNYLKPENIPNSISI